MSNPLAEISYNDLMKDVEVFCQERDLADKTDLIKRGALIAQNPADFESIDLLSEEEKEALRYEAAHKWKHPVALYFTIIVCSIGAAVQGWDQTGSNGANLSFPVVSSPSPVDRVCINNGADQISIGIWYWRR